MPGPRTRRSLPRILDALRAYDAERIYLFGSAARGEADDLSDVDLVIIKRTAQPWLDRLREVARLLPADVGGVDALVYTPEEFARMLDEGNAFAEMIAEEGRVLYERQAQS
jgi:predicted nucleotidyltransferase